MKPFFQPLIGIVVLLFIVAACRSTAVYTPAIQESMLQAGDVTLFMRTVGNVESGQVLITINGGPGLTSDYVREVVEKIQNHFGDI